MTYHNEGSGELMEEKEWRFPTDERKRTEALNIVRQAVLEKRIRYYPSFLENVWNQMQYRDWKHWALEGGLLLFSVFFSVFLCRNNMDEREAVTICSVFFVFAGNICLSGVMQLFSFHMAELEQTLYLNLKQMVCIRMLEAGVSAFFILSLFAAACGESTGMGAGSCLLYMLVPFLWSDALYLFMLGFFRKKASIFRSFVMGFFCGAAALFPVLWETAYEPEYKGVWLLLSAAGIVFLSVQIYHILKISEGGDSLCLN